MEHKARLSTFAFVVQREAGAQGREGVHPTPPPSRLEVPLPPPSPALLWEGQPRSSQWTEPLDASSQLVQCLPIFLFLLLFLSFLLLSASYFFQFQFTLSITLYSFQPRLL